MSAVSMPSLTSASATDVLASRSLPVADAVELSAVCARLREGALVPYLGPEMIAPGAPVPTTPEALAAVLNKRIAVPGRIRGNLWASAQFIESQRHHRTLTRLMTEIFTPPVAPTVFQCALARLPLPMIVDVWYDGAMRAALCATGRADWGEVQGIKRGAEFRDIWAKAYTAAGEEVPLAEAAQWTTLLYKPHGAVAPASNYLVSDSDYVEVLTEIDIQSPIPEAVKLRRADRAFLFIGTRFHDQMLRSYARQIIKRAGSGHVALLAPGAEPTRNELKFFAECGIRAMTTDARTIDALLG